MPRLVVADTSCFQYLFQADCLDLLPKLYGQIAIPPAVTAELERGRSLGVSLPKPAELPWLLPMEPVPIVAVIPNLGAGEREVISLAKSAPDALAILDDALARAYAKRLGVTFTGTLGVLLKAKQLGMIESLTLLLDRLDKLGFRLDVDTRQAALKLAEELL